MTIEKKIFLDRILYNDIQLYCASNNINDVDAYIIKIIKSGHTIEKYGATPIPPEKIIKQTIEVPVEKEIFITDNKELMVLTEKITQITKELNQTKFLLEEEKKKNRNIYGE